ncbi:YfjI family protein, partial [Pseudonocardia xishanensis]|uniref:YfjI family protein n=1 Tax=Pseudonocardia xishanensis TaxID=630995 RepID=UPI0031E86509
MDFTTDQLPTPVPLHRRRSSALFPVDALPSWVRDWVAAEAEATQTPVDLAACCALGVLAACAGGRAVVIARPGWTEPVNLYLLPVLPPASRKTAVVNAATAPLYAAESDLAEQVSGELVEAATLREVAEKAASRAMQAAANAAPERREELTAEAVSASTAAQAIDVPRVPRLIADDVTPEAVGSLLADHGGRLAIISAEGGLFDVMGGKYSAGVPSLDVWLKGHSGDPLRVDRKGRPSEYVRAPALTLLLTVQPAVLAAVAGNGAFRGRGLTARFLYALPPDNVGHRRIGAPPVPPEISAAWDKHVRALVVEFAGWTDPAQLRLDDDAAEYLLDLERTIEPRLARDGDLAGIREWAGKSVGAVLRIAALLHVAGVDSAFRRPISRDTLASAAVIGEYFTDHAQAAFDLLGDDGVSDAEYVLALLARKKLPEFSIRQLLSALPRGKFGSSEEVRAAVSVLEEHGWVIEQPVPPRTGAGRPPSPKFRTHPAVLSAESAESAEQADGARDQPGKAAGPRTAEPRRNSAQPSPAVAEPPAAAPPAGLSADMPCLRTWVTSLHQDIGDAVG